jgi:hypothetical protein
MELVHDHVEWRALVLAVSATLVILSKFNPHISLRIILTVD